MTRTVSPLASELMMRTCSQRSEEDDVDEAEDLDVLEGDCASAPKGVSHSSAVVTRAVLARIPLLRSDMTGCLLAGAGPVLGDRYESAGKKVSRMEGPSNRVMK